MNNLIFPAKLIWSRLVFIFWKSDLTLLRVYLAVASILWGAGLVLHDDTARTMAGMTLLLPIMAWAIAFLTHGLLTLLFMLLFIVGHVTGRSIILIRAAGCFIWTSAACATIFNGSYHPDFSANATLAIASWWILARTDE